MSAMAETSARIVSAANLGAPESADPARCSIAAIEALSHAAGPAFRITSLALDVASQRLAEGEVSIRSSVDKRTRSIVFVSAEAWQGKLLVFSAQGLFSITKNTP